MARLRTETETLRFVEDSVENHGVISRVEHLQKEAPQLLRPEYVNLAHALDKLAKALSAE